MARRALPVLCTLLLLGLPATPGSTATSTTVDALGAVVDGESVSVRGKATFAGAGLVSVGTDPAGDFAGPPEAGMDLTEALIGQPHPRSGDLQFVLRVAGMPPTGALPETVRYQWDFAVHRPGSETPVPFEIDGKLTDVARRQSTRTPSFVLRGGCTTATNVITCVDVSALDAVVDPAAKEIRITVPRALLEEQIGASLDGASIGRADVCEGISAKLSAYASLCDGPGASTGDALIQEEEARYPVASRQVQIAIAAQGEAPDFGPVAATPVGSDGVFAASVPAGASSGDVWARACFGSSCGEARAPLGTPLPTFTQQWNPPVLVHGVQAHRETSIALSPTNPNLMFVCDPSGVPNINGNQSYFHRSVNGGTSWSPLDVEGGSTDPRNYAFEGGDCDVAFDEAGTMYSADTWLGNLSVGHSFDGGATWDGTSLAVSAPIVDRPWLVGGPAGTLHLTYQDLQCCMPSTIWYTRSTDSGKTFLPAVPVADAGPNGAFTWEGNPVVAPGGAHIYLVYTRRQGPALSSLDSMGPETVWVAASHDAGATWTSHLVASMPNPASYLYPSIAMDRAGYLHVVFSSRTDTDRPIWYAFSKDRAATWSQPVPVMRGAAGFSPWIAADGKGEAAIVWYGSPDPEARPGATYDWYFYWARVAGAHTGSPSFLSGTTTTTRIFRGSMPETPEFEMIRLDDAGRMHIGMSAYRSSGGTNRWAIYYQRTSLVQT